MSRGIWSGSGASEKLEVAGLTRHNLLIVNCGQDLNTAWNPCDASGLASLTPTAIAANTHNSVTDKGPEGGPHFVLTPQTEGGSQTFGFQWSLFVAGIPALQQASPDTGGYTVTIWALIENTQTPNGAFLPVWAAMDPTTGVGLGELWHSFDVNASALRFQFENLETDPTTQNLSIGIALAPL